MKKILYVICFINLTFAFADMPENVKTAFEKFEQDTVFSYSYYCYHKGNAENFIEKFDPSLKSGAQWELISVDGQPPERERLKKYYESKDNVKHERKFSFKGDDMISFVLVNENPNYQTYSFQLKKNKKNKIAQYLVCKLDVRKVNPIISKIEMYIEHPVSPMFSVKLNKFKIVMVFQQMADTGANLIKSIKTVVSGKAFLFKEFDEESFVEYREYKLVN